MNCPICSLTECRELEVLPNRARYSCVGCGRFSLTDRARGSLENQPITDPLQITNARGWLRWHPESILDLEDIHALEALPSLSVGERAQNLLVAMATHHPQIGAKINLSYGQNESLFWRAYSSSSSADELKYLVREYLIKTRGWLKDVSSLSNFSEVQISPNGHEHIESRKYSAPELDVGFCAMWFGSEVVSLWTDAIKPAIEGAGYRAVRIDGVQHNNKIDDEILANIRRSKFVVADFTGHRGGVYFEAGFALGLGRQVIWTVRRDALAETHFDNRQYNFLIWDEGQMEEFTNALRLRIEATIGRGPVSVP